MSPEDSNSSSLNTKPDFSSVPLPEPSPIKSPYAPVGGTLGDVADDISQNDTNSANPPAPIESKSQSSEIPAAEKTNKKESDAQEPPVETKIKDKKRLKFPKKFIIIGAAAVAGIACLVVVISVIANHKDYGPGSNGKSGSFFNTQAVFAPFDANKTKYALVNDGKMGDYEYSYTSVFIDGFALVKKNSEYGIIDEAGNITVDFGEYDNLVEYGGLYGATKDNHNMLIDGQGRVIREYGDEFKDYGEMEVSTRAALTIFPEGDKKYSIYSPRGERLAGFESSDKPTISSTNLINTESTTAVVYSGGIYIYDDAGKEIQHIEQNVAKKYLVIDSSKDRSVIVLSTKPGKVNRTERNDSKYGILYDVLHDERQNAAIVNGGLNEYDNSRCTNIIYETSYGGGEGGYLACLFENERVMPYGSGEIKSVEQYQHFIDNQGRLTDYLISIESLATGSNIYPLTSGDYIVKENGGNYALYADGKKKTSFKSRNDANGVVKYAVLNNFAGRYTVQRLTLGPTGDDRVSVDLSFYDRNGNKVCTLKDGYSVNTPKVSFNPDGTRKVDIEWLSAGDVGYRNNLSLVTYGNGISAVDVYSLSTSGEDNSLALIDDECNEIEGERYYTALGFKHYGFSGDAMLLSKKEKENIYFYSATAHKDKAKTSIEVSTYPKGQESGGIINENYKIVGFLQDRIVTYKDKTIIKLPPVYYKYALADTCLMIYNEGSSSDKRIVYVFSLDGKILYTNRKESL